MKNTNVNVRIVTRHKAFNDEIETLIIKRLCVELGTPDFNMLVSFSVSPYLNCVATATVRNEADGCFKLYNFAYDMYEGYYIC